MEKSNSEKFYEKTGMNRCLEGETAFCVVQCPFHYDIPGFISKIQRGNFNSAFRDFKNATGFPGIALALCDERCNSHCPRKDKDSPVQLKALEQASLELAGNTRPTVYNVPPKNKAIAIVGAGICGMACALRLCEKKYQVDIYEKTNDIGGHLWNVMEPSVFLEDIEKQFTNEHYNLYLNCHIESATSFRRQYDAIFYASGSEGFYTSGENTFLGGALLGLDDLEALVDGLEKSKQIEAFLKTGIKNNPEKQYITRIPTPDLTEVPTQPLALRGSLNHRKEDCIAEANRCLKCSCDACRKSCDLLMHYGKSPLKAMEEVRATTQVRGVLSENMPIATKMIASCRQCGLCREICPEKIDFKIIMLEARRALHKKGILPWAFHDFFLNEMAYANSDAEIIINPLETDHPRYIFFPGCQLGASDPRYVAKSFQLLLNSYPDTVLIDRCCGAPAVWSGDEELQAGVFGEFQEKWEALHKPDIIFACPTCKKIFQEYLPEIKSVFLYTLLDNTNICIDCNHAGAQASVFDSCNAREEKELHTAVRNLSEKAGYYLEEMKYSKNMAKCCGYGGNTKVVNPDMAADVTKNRIGQNDNIFITYCSNCRDVFAEYGKNAVHILDIVLNINDANRPAPDINTKKRNRQSLKKQMIAGFTGFKCDKQMETENRIIISPELKPKLNNKLIYEDDVIDVVRYCESSNNKFFISNRDVYCGHKQLGRVTYWVEYRYLGDRIEITNAYSHRITIKE